MVFSSIISFLTSLLQGNKFNLIPIVTRVFIFFVISNLSIGNQLKYRLQLGFMSIFLGNMLRLIFPSDPKNKCTSANTSALPIGVIIEQILNSIIQYAFSSLIPKLFVFIPVIGMGLRAATKIPIIGGIIEFIYWIIGYRTGIAMTTGGFKLLWLIPIGETGGSMCEGSTGMMKKLLGFMSFLYILFLEVMNTATDNLPF